MLFRSGKKIKGKKRHTAVDTLGLLINFAVSPGDVQDRNMIAPLLAIACKRFPSLQKAIADGAYQGKPTADDVKEQAGNSTRDRQAFRRSKGVLRDFICLSLLQVSMSAPPAPAASVPG